METAAPCSLLHLPFFPLIKQEITEINGKNSMLKIMLGDANRMMKFYLTKEKSLVEGECYTSDTVSYETPLCLCSRCFSVLAPSHGDLAKLQFGRPGVFFFFLAQENKSRLISGCIWFKLKYTWSCSIWDSFYHVMMLNLDLKFDLTSFPVPVPLQACRH